MIAPSLAFLFSEKERPYTGVELRPHFLLTELGLKGSGIAAFIGPCSVKTEHLVDWEDRLAQDRIEARKMVHFIGEFFGMGLREGVLLQRLFMAAAGDSIREQLDVRNRAKAKKAGKSTGKKDPVLSMQLERSGDDLFIQSGGGGGAGRKLSVSIVTASPVSVLLHAGINIDPQGAPVPAIGLKEMGIDAVEWAPEFLERFSAEWDSIQWACAKVRPVV
ncbi:MAG TPA: hypothetical protein DCS07_05410 [Bdellovibrionales bacterium]|nr:MAG: hypothetical protein A2Z97_09025 [Bdellovibrionales bacterium GWB1_52_6]OFZ06297.1 MAG: hypothetical protein A2X97_02425 [Bdellovibrionales bacterium GWA1_52_35]OFZ36140.1 MAG: hypothetical protein A2070_04435 [Bdellovibrionales bacterium GWC1_52_8]HAR42056.1 hypothetical protein [Bdellovibrionales bacterium]HCM40046.1 hypothetical protein [Bdellovibrionales bacterium]